MSNSHQLMNSDENLNVLTFTFFRILISIVSIFEHNTFHEYNHIVHLFADYTYYTEIIRIITLSLSKKFHIIISINLEIRF